MLNAMENIFWNSWIKNHPEFPEDALVSASMPGNQDIADSLVTLYLEGKKTAGSGLVRDYEIAGDPLPKVGNFWIVLGSDSTPRCILKTVRVEIHRFPEITEEIARAEGEGDCSLAHWRAAHTQFFTPLLSSLGIADLENAMIVTEFFQLVFRLDSNDGRKEDAIMQDGNSSPARPAFVDSKAFPLLMGALTALDPLTIDMYLPSFPDIQQQLNTGYSNVELSLSSFFIGMALGQLVYGPLADRFGRKRPLIFGMCLYIISSLACALAPNVELLILFRILQAFGGCAGMVITGAIVRDCFNGKTAAQLFSSLTLVSGLAPILAPILGNFINHNFGWRAIFMVLAACSLSCALCILKFLPETHHNRHTDLTLSKAFHRYAGLLKTREFVGYVIPDALLRAGMFAYIAGSPFVFIELFHLQPKQYSLLFGLNGMGIFAAARINRLLLKHFEPQQILFYVRRFSMLAGIILLVMPFVVYSFWSVAIPLFFFVASIGMVGPNSMATALSKQGHQAGSAAAFYGTLSWSVAILTTFVVSHLHNGTLVPMTATIACCGIIRISVSDF